MAPRPLSHRVGRSVGPSVRRSVTLCFFLHFWAFSGLESLYLSMPLPKSSQPLPKSLLPLPKSVLPLPNRPRQEQSCIRPCSYSPASTSQYLFRCGAENLFPVFDRFRAERGASLRFGRANRLRSQVCRH